MKKTNLEKGVSPWEDAFRRLLKNKVACFGGIVLLIEIFIAVITPWIAPYPFDETFLELAYATPSSAHWLGNDELGRDLLTRILYGTRISLLVGFLSSGVAVIVGVLYGVISGFTGGRLDNLMMRAVDVFYALPFVFLVIILMVYFGRNIYLLFIALGLTQWLTMARIVRGQVISIKEKEFVLAARSIGVPNFTIMTRHLIPNTMGPVIVYLTLTIPTVMLEEAFLSFLGLGIQAPMASLGTLISSGEKAIEVIPTLLCFPAAILAITLFSLNFLGDGLRDALDPKGAKD